MSATLVGTIDAPWFSQVVQSKIVRITKAPATKRAPK